MHHKLSHGIIKVNDQDGPPKDPTSRKNETDLSLLSRIYDDETSLGLTGISWVRNFPIKLYIVSYVMIFQMADSNYNIWKQNDSLGPFDLGMPAQKLTGGDSVSIGGFVR